MAQNGVVGAAIATDSDDVCTLQAAFDPTEIKPWPSERFEMVKKLQDAHRNHGMVHLMMDRQENKFVAVKEMPVTWIGLCHEEFMAIHPKESEFPWQDIGCTRYLNSIGFPFGCELLGVYRNDGNIEVVMTYCSEGDLFTWCGNPPSKDLKPGPEREVFVRPVVTQLMKGVRQLHELSIVHRDISMENILLSKDESGDTLLKIIDFGMASTVRRFQRSVRGKVSYQAPELHDDEVYDAFLADAFSVGVTLYAICFKDYPWISTKPGGCKCFEYTKKYGLRAYTKKKKVYGARDSIADRTSEDLLRLLEGLLETDPAKRLTLGESAFSEGGAWRRSVWDEAWLQDGIQSL